MEGVNMDTKSLVELRLSFKRQPTILWNVFGIGLTYLQSSMENQSWLDTKIRNDLVPTRCDVGFFRWYHTELGDEDEEVASYEPEKGHNAIILAVKNVNKNRFKEFPGFVELIDACSDLQNASKNLGFKEEGIVVCPTYVELMDDLLALHITCYVPKSMGRLRMDVIREGIAHKFECGCGIYRWQYP